MFRKEEYQIDQFTVCRIINDKGVFADIIPVLGAMVYQIGLLDEDGEVTIILESDSPAELESNPWFRGRILFPFNDRIPGGQYTFDGVDYQLPINEEEDGSSIHGLVYNKPFVVSEEILNDDSGSIKLSYTINADDFESYPFSVKLEVVYAISDSGFSVDYRICNCDDKALPVALGWHPYFSPGKAINSLRMKCGGGSFVEVDETLNPTGELVSVTGTDLDYHQFKELGDRELDIAFTLPSDGITLLNNESRTLELIFDAGFFPYVQLFTPPKRKSIAIEPVTAATNSFNIDGLGKMVLNSGERRSGSVKINLNHLI